MTSYKTLYQEAIAQAERLADEVERLRALIQAGSDENAKEVERIRQVVVLAGIARHMKVERFTPQQWKQRGHLPPVDFPAIAEPLWYVSTLKKHFVTPTRRVWYDDVPAEELSPAA